MNAQELYRADGKPSGFFCCESCRITHQTKEGADQCCAPSVCEKCGVEVVRYSSFCRACLQQHDAEEENQRFAEATKLTEWSGPVWVNDLGYDDGYFESVELLEDHLLWLARNNEPVPEITYAWTCHEHPSCPLYLDHIIENATDEAHDGFDISELYGVDELKTAIDKFNDLNQSVVSWTPDMTVCVLLNKKEGS